MKKIYLIAIFAMAALAASAQTHVSVIAAPQFDGKIAARFGIDADISFGETSKFSFVPGFYYSMRNNDFSMQWKTAEYKETICSGSDLSHWISVPLRFAFTIKKGSENLQTQILLGPYFALGLGGTTTYKEPSHKTIGSFEKGGFYDRRFDVGLNAGVNFIIKKHFVVGVFGELGFIPLGANMSETFAEILANAYSLHGAGGINIGYRF